ncbi:MAG: Nif3-like dinuclear metal center hexameric protein, partial [Deltaproteobacteria bacterium]|nr:Nif3-like dinuclear metal center hexameric protein [Deltaproteobacteria bacterium]
AKVERAALALDPSKANIIKALDLDCQLLITHHPLIFKPIKRLSFSDPATAPACLALSRGLAVVSAHTNWDAVGVAHELADILGLTVQHPLSGNCRRFLKLVVFVPESHEEEVRRAVQAIGAGTIGGYDCCFFKAQGTGGFKAPTGSQPFLGQPGEEHAAPEARLEIILPPNLRDKAALAVLSAHPYEEPALEFHQIDVPGPGFGLVGRWNPPRDDAARFIQAILGQNGLWAGPEPGPVHTVALMPGSGGSYVEAAYAHGAQVLVTGDVDHHQALMASEIGLAVFSAGHFETERPSLARLARELAREVASAGGGAELTILDEIPPFRRI